MPNITCCELMFVIIETNDKISKSAKEIVDAEKSKDQVALALLWKSGAETLTIMIADKLWKEDRFCPKCDENYQKMQKEHTEILKSQILAFDG